MTEDLNRDVPAEAATAAIAGPATMPVTGSIDPSSQLLPELAGPWSRFWARYFDFALWVTVIYFPIGWFAPSALETPLWILTYFATLPLAWTLDAGVYFFCGNTPGKALAGIRVLDAKGKKVGFVRYLSRNSQVFIKGLALGTIIAVITLLQAYEKLRAQETLSWDEKTDARVFQIRSGWWRPWVLGSLYIGIVGGLGYFGIFMKSPQNQIQVIASAVNVGTPKMIDEVTRFDSIQALPDVTLQYNYTILSEEADDADQEYRESFIGEMSEQLKKSMCEADDMKILQDLGTTLRFRYSNRVGGLIGVFSLPLKDCAKRSKE